MKVQFTETVLRDANQSLIATRLPFTPNLTAFLKQWTKRVIIHLNAGAVQHLTPAFATSTKIRGKDSVKSEQNAPIQNFKCF